MARRHIMESTFRLNLLNPQHAKINEVIKGLNPKIYKSKNQFLIEACEFYIDHYGEDDIPSKEEKRYVFLSFIEKLKIQADEYRQAASQYESAEKTVAQLKAEMLRFKGKRKLTQEMVDLFVAQVRIYENKNLEIVLNYEDELKKFAELNMEREAG